MPPRIGNRLAQVISLLEAAPFQDPLSEDLMNIGKLRIVSYLAGLTGVLVTSSAFAQAADAAPAAAD
jgi:hypothetical protein